MVPSHSCKALKGRPAIRTPTQPLADTPREATRDTPKASRRDERAYQGLTIAFVLLLLASLWLFR
jgi:hypothetical protein